MSNEGFIYLKPVVTGAMDIYPDGKKWGRRLWRWAYIELERLNQVDNLVALKGEIKEHRGGSIPAEVMKRYITRSIAQEVLRQSLWEGEGGRVCRDDCDGSRKCPYNDLPEELLCPFRMMGWKRMNRDFKSNNHDSQIEVQT